jgi:hypothetical protein
MNRETQLVSPPTSDRVGQRRHHSGLLIVISLYFTFGIAFAAPWGFTAISLDEMLAHGWPGPWSSEMSALNGGESILGLTFGLALAVVLLLVAGAAAGIVAARHGVNWMLVVITGTLTVLVAYVPPTLLVLS